MKFTRRAGVSIIEMMVVISLAAVLISLSGVCLHGMYRAHARLDGNLQRRAALDRLALQLRCDAHAAEQATLVDEEAAATIVMIQTTDKTEIRYRSDGSDVVRTVTRGETVVHRDLFRLPGVERMEWTLLDQARPTVNVTVRPTEGLSRDGTAVPLTLRATVGLHE